MSALAERAHRARVTHRRSARIVLCLVTLALGTSCRGPDPVVTQQRLLPGGAGQLLRVEAVVRNRSGGSGQVAIVADVTEHDSRMLVVRESKEIELDGHGSQGVVLELRVPSQLDAAARDRLELHVVAHYPIE